MTEVADRGTDRVGVPIDDAYRQATGDGLHGVRQADDSGTHDDQVGVGSCRGHVPDGLGPMATGQRQSARCLQVAMPFTSHSESFSRRPIE